MKNKGFMLIETLIASTIILGALIFLFVQFSAIKRGYETSFKYNTIPGLYKGKILADFLKENGYDNIDSELNNTNKGYVKLNDNCHLGKWSIAQTELCNKIINNIDSKVVLYVGNNILNLQNALKTNDINNYDSNIFDNELKQFVISLDSIEINQRKRLIIEYNDDTYAVITLNN